MSYFSRNRSYRESVKVKDVSDQQFDASHCFPSEPSPVGSSSIDTKREWKCISEINYISLMAC